MSLRGLRSWRCWNTNSPAITIFDLVTLTISPRAILAVIGVGVIVAGLTPIVSLRRLRRMVIPSTLRVME